MGRKPSQLGDTEVISRNQSNVEYWMISMKAVPSERTPEDRKLYRNATRGVRTDGFRTEADALSAFEKLPQEVQDICRVNEYLPL